MMQAPTCVFVLSGLSTMKRGRERQRPAHSGDWSLSGSGEITPKYSHREYNDLRKVTVNPGMELPQKSIAVLSSLMSPLHEE